MKTVRDIAIIFALFSFSFAAWKVCILVDRVSAQVPVIGANVYQAAQSVELTALAIDKTATQIEIMREHVDRTLIVAGATMSNIEKATRSLKAQEDAQAQYWAETSRNVATVSHDADTMVNQAGESLKTLNATMLELQPVIRNAAAVIGDPSIPQAMAGLNASSKNLAQVTQNTAIVTDDARKVADHYAEQILKPVSKTHSALVYIGKWTATVLGNALHF